MKTLKREEIYATLYRNLDHLRANFTAFIEEYYNGTRIIRHLITTTERV